MARNENLTYEKVVTVCDQLLKANEKPSVRTIRQYIGGNPKTVLTFLSQWRDQQALASTINTEISDPFQQALLAEMGRVTAAIKQQLTEQLTERKKDLEEAQEWLAEQTATIETLKEELAAVKVAAEQQSLTLEKELAAAQARLQDSAQREIALQQQLERLREQKHVAELNAIRAETQAQELQKQFNAWSSTSSTESKPLTKKQKQL